MAETKDNAGGRGKQRKLQTTPPIRKVKPVTVKK